MSSDKEESAMINPCLERQEDDTLTEQNMEFIKSIKDPVEQRETAAEYRRLNKICPMTTFDFDLCEICNQKLKGSILSDTVGKFFHKKCCVKIYRQ